MIRVNLIPHDLQMRHMRRRRLKLWAVCNALTGLALLLPLGLEWLNRTEAETLRQGNLEVQRHLSTSQAELRGVRGEAEQRLLQIQRADALRSKRAWSGMIGLIARSLPPACWLTRVATDPAAPHGSGGRVAHSTPGRPGRPGSSETAEVVTIDAPRKLRLSGYASTPVEPLALVTNLKNQGIFSYVTLEQSQLEPAAAAPLFRFELVCGW